MALLSVFTPPPILPSSISFPSLQLFPPSPTSHFQGLYSKTLLFTEAKSLMHDTQSAKFWATPRSSTTRAAPSCIGRSMELGGAHARVATALLRLLQMPRITLSMASSASTVLITTLGSCKRRKCRLRESTSGTFTTPLHSISQLRYRIIPWSFLVR